MANAASNIWGDFVNTIKSIPKGAENDLSAVIHAAEGSPAVLGHLLNSLSSMLSGSVPMVTADKAIEQVGSQATQGGSSSPYSTTPGSGGQVGSSAEDQYHPNAPGAPKGTTSSAPTTSLFNLQAALQPYVQPYENALDVELGSKPGKAPTVAQAESAGMSQLAPYLQGLPAGLAQTITNAARPEFAAAAGLPTAINASVQTEPYAGLLTDLISAARNQMIYGAGIGTPAPPGPLGAIFSDVTNAGTGLSGLGGAVGLTTPQTTTTTPAPSSTSIPGS